jgi:hypothetical protein
MVHYFGMLQQSATVSSPSTKYATVFNLPYGGGCTARLFLAFLSFRFLASLINPHEPQNTEPQIQIGLSLISCALEVSPQDLLCGICAIIWF